ncbi:hypothetical protein LTS12_014450 [Elasticomyces elasticus]|nr:hypothetical protein LTS12_014450 [Elasticomyces elasticus]
MTPPLDSRLHPDMDLIVGGALAPVHTTQPECSKPRAGVGLRLPSFEQQFDGAVSESGLVTELSGGSLGSELSVPAQMEASVAKPRSGLSNSGRGLQKSLPNYISVLTPPADARELTWTVPTSTASSEATLPQALSVGEAAGAEVVPLGQVPNTFVAPLRFADDTDRWIDGALEALLENQRTAQIPSNPLRVLSHALPSPSSEGHIFPTIIGAIHDSTPSSPTQWINVFHAIPGRFNLADLPTSPPATPGPAIAGEDYFTQKTFDSAVPISDYQGDLSALP